MRICVFSERMAPPFDEGIKNYALQLAQWLSRDHQVLTLTAFGADVPEMALRNVSANRLLLALPLFREIRRFRPDVTLYVPTASTTLFSFLRSRVLRWYGCGAPVALVALQIRPRLRRYGPLRRAAMSRTMPDIVLAQSDATRELLRPFGCRTALVPPGIDLRRFHPVDDRKRSALCERFGIDAGAYVVLHVGHLNRGRNVQAMIALQRMPGYQAVVVGSTSTTQDRALEAELVHAGVRVIAQHVPDVASIYQMADCYVFPVNAQTSAIDLPLSVLEAMACDLPVVTTRFGGLDSFFEPAPGFRFFDTGTELVAAVEACRTVERAGTRSMVEPYSWEHTAHRMMDIVCSELSLGRPRGNRPIHKDDQERDPAIS